MSTLVNPVVGAKILASDLGSYYSLLKGIAGSGDLITQFYKGANLASAATITPSAGNFFHVTGTTTITAIGAAPAGTGIILVFDGILTLTHNVTSLILLGGVSVTTTAGDVFGFISDDGTNWREVFRLKVATATTPGYVPTPPNNTTTFLRGDATFAVPPSGSGGTPAVILGTAAAAGVATTFLRDDDTIVAFDATVPSAIGAAAVGTATVASRRDHVHPMTNGNAKLGADVTMTTAGTAYDGPSLSLVAGTWLVIGHMTYILPASIATVTMRIGDGTTHYASQDQTTSASNPGGITCATIIVLGGTTTIKIQAQSTANSTTMKATTNYSAGNNATQITAVRVA